METQLLTINILIFIYLTYLLTAKTSFKLTENEKKSALAHMLTHTMTQKESNYQLEMVKL